MSFFIILLTITIILIGLMFWVILNSKRRLNGILDEMIKEEEEMNKFFKKMLKEKEACK